jgi:beta-1,4-mannosyl-glycoprotein beta-1,4-N-acetylglucosaminyltransferase
MKIIDCFSFYNELDLLTYRLNLLNDYVDYFVIVEARQTHAGKDKILFFKENKHLYEEFSEKIIHHVVDLPYKFENTNITYNEIWVNENFQRNVISQCLLNVKNLSPLDIIILSDLDEICDPRILLKIKEGDIAVDINSLEMDLYYYNLNTINKEKWNSGKIMTYKKYTELNKNFTEIRLGNYTSILSAGWHMSYFGDEHFISNKIKNFAHSEFNLPEITDLEKIKEKIKNCSDLYNRSSDNFLKIEIKDNLNLPPDYDKYLKRYYK